jgi:glycosyltransferase involved in cell wall biosynthesis
VTGSSKTAVFKKCNVFVLPSFYEGLPMALLESMSFGLVPVITDVGSINHVVTDGVNGLFVRSRSASDIENALWKLADDVKLRNDLSSNAREFIFSNFNPRSYVEKLNEIYNYE